MNSPKLEKELKGTRMISIVLQCIQAIQIAHGVSFDDIRATRKKNVLVVFARYSLFHLLRRHTKLSIKECEKIMNQSSGNPLIRDYLKNSSPVFRAMREKENEVFEEVVKLEYDKEIPF